MASVSDNFNRASLGSNWTADSGGWTIISSTYVQSDSGTSAISLMRYTGTAMDSANHYVQALRRDAPGAGHAGVTARQASATATYYVADYEGEWSGSGGWRMQKVVSGSATTLDSGNPLGWGEQVTLYLEVDGTSISATLDSGQDLSATDSAITSGTYTGLSGGWEDAGEFDDFEAADLGPTIVSEPIPEGGVVELIGVAPDTSIVGNSTAAPPNGVLELVGVAPATSIVGNSTAAPPAGLLELVGIAPTTFQVAPTVISEPIPPGTLTFNGIAPKRENNYTGTEVLELIGFAPAYSIQGVVSAAIPVATFELIGFAPETLAVGLALEPIPAGTLTLTGFAPESQVTGGADEGIPSGTLELVGFAPATQQIGTQSEGIPNNVIYLSSYAPGYNIPGQVGPRRKTGGKRGRPRPRRIVIIGGQRHVVHSYTEERYLLEQYLKRLQIEESQEEAPEVRKRPVKLVSRNISLTETRIAKLDQRVEWHHKKLRQEDDLLLSLFG